MMYTIEEELIPVYRVVYPDGSRSIAYNKTRAKEYCRRLNEGEKEKDIKIGYTLRD